MNALTPLMFASAYRQLRPAEKLFVDSYVASVEADAERHNERISNALHRAVPEAARAASRGMMDKPLVMAAISERINEIAAASELTVARVIKELSAMAFSSMGNYMVVGEDGFPYFDLAKCTPEQMSAIAHVKTETSMSGRGTAKFEIKLHDKLGSIDKLMRYMGLLDPENPFWRADSAKPVNAVALPGNVTDEAAADVYAKMING